MDLLPPVRHRGQFSTFALRYGNSRSGPWEDGLLDSGLSVEVVKTIWNVFFYKKIVFCKMAFLPLVWLAPTGPSSLLHWFSPGIPEDGPMWGLNSLYFKGVNGSHFCKSGTCFRASLRRHPWVSWFPHDARRLRPFCRLHLHSSAS